MLYDACMSERERERERKMVLVDESQTCRDIERRYEQRHQQQELAGEESKW